MLRARRGLLSNATKAEAQELPTSIISFFVQQRPESGAVEPILSRRNALPVEIAHCAQFGLPINRGLRALNTTVTLAG
jgi:hypothetical protein